MTDQANNGGVPEWVNRYIGIPYVSRGRTLGACDCWGLISLIYREIYDINIPVYYYDNAEDTKSIVEAFGDNVGSWEQVNRPLVGDVVFLNIGGHPIHAGLYIGENRMIHSLAGHDSAIESINGLRWLSRINGYYRWDA